jgi:Bacterial Ig-like domain (group 3)
VSISNRFSGFVPCSLLSMFAFAAVAGLCSSATAQTAPQLLPYTAKLIAGGGTAAIGATCPVSGLASTDAYGDGCLATEIQLVAPRYATSDSQGNIFFSDYTNGLVRRVDAITGIVTAVAGGAASSPANGTTCGTGNSSSDANGDGCPATLVKLSHPVGLIFSATTGTPGAAGTTGGDLYFADNGYDNVRKVAATNGLITTTGIISNIAGNVTTFGYNVNNTSSTGTVNAATQSYLDFPYGLAFDGAGNLYIGDEGNNALEVVNLTSATEILQGMSVPAGSIAKFVGFGSLGAKSATSGDCPDFVSTATGARGGCYFGSWTDGKAGNVSNIDGGYSVAVDTAGTVFFTNEFNTNIGTVTLGNVLNTGNVLSDYAGIQSSIGKTLTRGPASTTGIGSPFGIAVDSVDNLYFTDASSGVIWRVDGSSKLMYVIAGGAATICSGAIDTYGDGCPATQATFGSSGGTGTFASTKGTGPGIFGLSVDKYADLFVGDTVTNIVREVASGTQFGVVGANQPTQTVDIHFAAGDSPASAGAYTLSAGASNFTLGTATCTTNGDTTKDCLLPVTATPSTLGLFTGTLQVTATLGGTASFPLSGTYAQSPVTRTVLTYTASSVNCTGTSVYSTSTPITLTAMLIANGPNPPGGMVTFYSNGTQIGTQAVSNLGTSSNPAYGAAFTYTFATVGTYSITATYSGDSYFKTSTSAASSVTSSNPSFTASTISYQQNTVAAGQTGLYSFNLIQNVYNGTITLACSGLPANSSCSFSPTTVAATGCSTTNTVAMSINTQQGTKNGVAVASSLGGPGHGSWAALGMIPGLLMALFIGLRRRRVPMRYGQLWMALALLLATSGTIACNGNVQVVPATPAGSYNVTVTATGSAGTVASFTVPLTVK